MTAIMEIETAARSVDVEVGPAVVRVGRQGGRGCGVVVNDGQVLTNAHNLRGDEVTVTFADGRVATAAVAGVDVDGDLSVVRVDTAGVTAVAWVEADTETRAGDVVFAVSRSAAGGTRVSFGIVSATQRAFAGPRGRHITGSIEHTAPLVRGSSGSPIVDRTGRLVGLNTNRLGDGFYLAIPATGDLRDRVGALAAGHSPSTPSLGVGLAPSPVARRLRAAVGLPQRDGLLVRVVEEVSPAAQADLRAGDLLVAAGGRALESIEDLYQVLRDAGTSDGHGQLELFVVRGVDELTIVVTLAGRP